MGVEHVSDICLGRTTAQRMLAENLPTIKYSPRPGHEPTRKRAKGFQVSDSNRSAKGAPNLDVSCYVSWAWKRVTNNYDESMSLNLIIKKYSLFFCLPVSDADPLGVSLSFSFPISFSVCLSFFPTLSPSPTKNFIVGSNGFPPNAQD